ncbi:DUF1853 family protein [Microbulbifer sp. VAAC004]|uniref:DUF1853 family protein n=1 Tax=unclassified Microbulbifer TaxID=2619833 RepID=UPI0040399E99
MTNRLHRPVVDDWSNLLWSLGSSDIVDTSDKSTSTIDLPWLPMARRNQLHTYFSRKEVKQELIDKLETYLIEGDRHKPTNRLGVYFERLWSFAFQYHPDYQLLHQNLPLRIEGRTLGELDFVVHHLPSNRCEHWEVAVKFYLAQPVGFWVGPGLKDRLDIKLKRMAEHQLPLIQQQSVQTLLEAQELYIDRQWTLMPGRLFNRLPTLGNRTAGGNLKQLCNSNWWTDLETLGNLATQGNISVGLRWLQLPKKAWLASIEWEEPHGVSFEQLMAGLQSSAIDKPLCFALMGQEGEMGRGFIVPSDWPRRAQASLPLKYP